MPLPVRGELTGPSPARVLVLLTRIVIAQQHSGVYQQGSVERPRSTEQPSPAARSGRIQDIPGTPLLYTSIQTQCGEYYRILDPVSALEWSYMRSLSLGSTEGPGASQACTALS